MSQQESAEKLSLLLIVCGRTLNTQAHMIDTKLSVLFCWSSVCRTDGSQSERTNRQWEPMIVGCQGKQDRWPMVGDRRFCVYHFSYRHLTIQETKTLSTLRSCLVCLFGLWLCKKSFRPCPGRIPRKSMQCKSSEPHGGPCLAGHHPMRVCRGGLKSRPKFWRFLLLLLLTTSPSTCTRNSHNLISPALYAKQLAAVGYAIVIHASLHCAAHALSQRGERRDEAGNCHRKYGKEEGRRAKEGTTGW